MGRGRSKISGKKYDKRKRESVLSDGESKELNRELIQRANSASYFYEAGDAINRQYKRNIQTIKQLQHLSEKEKAQALSKLNEVTTEHLVAQSKSVSPYVTGRARLNTKQVRNRADATARKGASVESFMRETQKKSNENKKIKEKEKMMKAIKNAEKKGLMKITINGETLYRKRKNSKNWYKK